MDLRVLGLLTGSIDLAAVDLAFPFLITVICNLMSCGGRGRAHRIHADPATCLPYRHGHLSAVSVPARRVGGGRAR
jgi:hypothetical protein